MGLGGDFSYSEQDMTNLWSKIDEGKIKTFLKSLDL